MPSKTLKRCFLALALRAFLFDGFSPAAAGASADAEEARWLVQSASWGTMSYSEGDGVKSTVLSFAESGGRIFFYLMGVSAPVEGALTISEASLDPRGCAGGDVDPEDPRCAKLTASGTVSPCADEESCRAAEEVLFARHPQMEGWPEGHGFIAFEMDVADVWMIAAYGGGSVIGPVDYYAADPVHHPAYGASNAAAGAVTARRGGTAYESSAAAARKLVAASLWTVVSTTSVRLGGGHPWGNVRSMTDGASLIDSKGTPCFYLPTPDPTFADVAADGRIALSFSEASLPDGSGGEGSACGGTDPEDPTCAKISLGGRARELGVDELAAVEAAFAVTHPAASWLSDGGAHTGGKYYTIEVETVEFFRSYGGADSITVEEYLGWSPDDVASKLFSGLPAMAAGARCGLFDGKISPASFLLGLWCFALGYRRLCAWLAPGKEYEAVASPAKQVVITGMV